MGLTQSLTKGNSFPLTLQFEKTGKVQITVPVESAGALGPTEN
jgi:copper(I)-binding protein